LSFEKIIVGALQIREGRPLLAVPVYELPFILANGTTHRRFNGGLVLSATGRADKRLLYLAHITIDLWSRMFCRVKQSGIGDGRVD
jgi:hypothetical protein